MFGSCKYWKGQLQYNSPTQGMLKDGKAGESSQEMELLAQYILLSICWKAYVAEPRNTAYADSIRNLHKDWKKLELVLDMYKVYEGHSHHLYTYLSLRDSQTRISSFTHYRWQIAGKIYPWRIGVKSLHFSPKVSNKFSSTQQAFIKQALIWFRHCVCYWRSGRTQSMVPVPRLSGIFPSHGEGTEMHFFFLGSQDRSLLHIYVLLR